MRRRCFQAFLFSVAIGMAATGQAEESVKGRGGVESSSAWKPLFDGKSFDGWYKCLSGKKKDEDPGRIFQVEDGVIHVYKDQPDGGKVTYGYIATNEEYANYRVRMEYKWGTKRFAGRTQAKRDAGLLYHLLPPDRVWPRCLEFQIQEGDVGDCFTVSGAQVESSVVIDDSPKKLFHYKPMAQGGEVRMVGNGGIVRIVKSSTEEKDGWNKLELVVRGSEGSQHIVNGHTVFETSALRQLSSEKKSVLLGAGHIALQAEFAEVFYRNVEIQPLADKSLHPAAKP